MTTSTRDTTTRKRPPAPGVPVMVRLQPAMLQKVDVWAAKHNVSRPEAIRAMLAALVEMGGLDD